LQRPTRALGLVLLERHIDSNAAVLLLLQLKPKRQKRQKR
jgi:hypothetical protein